MSISDADKRAANAADTWRQATAAECKRLADAFQAAGRSDAAWLAARAAIALEQIPLLSLERLGVDALAALCDVPPSEIAGKAAERHIKRVAAQ